MKNKADALDDIKQHMQSLKVCAALAMNHPESTPLGYFELPIRQAVKSIRRKKLRNAVNQFAEHYLEVFKIFDAGIDTKLSLPEMVQALLPAEKKTSHKMQKAVMYMFITAAMSRCLDSVSSAARKYDVIACNMIFGLLKDEHHKRFSSEIERAISETILGDSLPVFTPGPLRRLYGKFTARVIHGKPSVT